MTRQHTTPSGARHRAFVRTAIAVAAMFVFATAWGCGGDEGSGDSDGEVVITCAACQSSPTDPFLQNNFETVQRFNDRYAGRYRIRIQQNQYAQSGADRLQYYQRLALANDLPDLFLSNTSEVKSLQKTGKLLDFAPILDEDSGWRSSFFQGAFDAFTGEDGQIWGIPSQRDTIGIYYNKSILRDAGVNEFPRTWDQLDAACKRVQAAGKICLAMDGDWVTLLMWANLIGTQPDGSVFLTAGLPSGDYAANPAAVRATETLKHWHTEGYVNRDAFSGDFEDASTPFVRGDAAMIANGPWFIKSGLQAKEAAKGLYNQAGYAVSPGWTPDDRGAIVVSEGAWASGSTDERSKEAVAAFLKFITSHDEAITKTRNTGSYPPVEIEFSEDESQALEPLAAGLVEEASNVPLSFPHVYVRAPSGFATAWKNLWPAYVKGDMDTNEFLTRLGDDATSPTA